LPPRHAGCDRLTGKSRGAGREEVTAWTQAIVSDAIYPMLANHPSGAPTASLAVSPLGGAAEKPETIEIQKYLLDVTFRQSGR